MSCAVALSLGANAQKLEKAPVSFNQLKLSSVEGVQFNGVAKKAPAKKVSTDQFIGTFINNSWDETNEINTATTDYMYKANVTTDDGTVLNLKWDIYAGIFGHVYARLDEKTNTFTIPAGQYFGDGAPIQITDDESSPVAFYGVGANGYFCDFEGQYDPATGLITPNDTIQGYLALITEGTYANKYVYANFSPTIARANAVMTGSISGEDGWSEFEQPVWLDYSAAEDGVVDVYNHLLSLTSQAGCKLSFDVDGTEASMATGQPMVYISNESDHAIYGKYILLRGVAIDESAGTVSPDFDMTTIEGGTYDAKTGEVAFPRVYYRGFSEIGADGRGYATNFFVNCYFTPATTGIAGVSNNVEKKADNRIFNLAGQQVSKNYKGVVIVNGHKKLQK